MKDLTDAEQAELDHTVYEFVQDRKLDGLEVVVVLRGRGIRKVSFSEDDKAALKPMLALAYQDANTYERMNTGSRTN